MLGKRLINSNSAASGATCTTDTLQILGDTSCIAYYKMSDATDESGSYDGTPTNVNFNVAGKFGNAVAFNGTSSKIVITGSPFNLTTYSLSFWINAADYNQSNTTIVNIGLDNTGGTWGGLAFGVSANKVFYYGGDSGFITQTGTTNITNATWVHVAMVVNANLITGYINGIQDTGLSRTLGAHITYRGGSINTIGVRQGAFGSYGWWNGNVDQVRIFNKALSSSEVTTLNNEVYCQPTIVPTDYFEPVLYTGTGSTQSITSLNFQPDLVWVKARGRGNPFTHRLTDSVRGVQKQLSSNTTDIEATENGVMSFDTAGFTLGDAAGFNIAASPNTFVAWNWKAGGAAVLNQEGTIDSQVSANVDAGFSIVSYTGNQSTSTIGHGLSSAPEMIIAKSRSVAQNWAVYHKDVGNQYWLRINGTNAKQDEPIWNDTTPTNSVFSINGNVVINASGSTNIAYCFHSVDGMSRVGSYVGTGASGNSILTGFRPAFLMTKRSDTGGTDWHIWDNKRNPSNPVDDVLFPNESYAEADYSAYPHNFLSNGFSVDTTNGAFNANGGSYIYMAFAEEVFNPNGVTRNATNPFGDASELALYKFEDNTTDSEGTYGTASNSGVSYISSGYIDKSISFTGTTSTVNTTIPNGHTQTWSFWAKIPNSFTGDRIISALNSSGDAGQAITYSSSSNFYIYDYIGGASVNAITVAWANDGGWHHFAFSKNATTSVIYVDGSKLATLNAYSGNFQTGNNITFGKGLYGNALVGLQLDQVRIFNRALDSGEITQLYNE